MWLIVCWLQCFPRIWGLDRIWERSGAEALLPPGSSFARLETPDARVAERCRRLWRRGIVRGPSAARLRRFAEDDDSSGAGVTGSGGGGLRILGWENCRDSLGAYEDDRAPSQFQWVGEAGAADFSHAV